MRLERIIRAVYGQPWLITKSGHDSVCRLLENKLQSIVQPWEAMNGEGKFMKTDIFGEPLPEMSFDASSRVAVIPVYGVIGNKLGLLEKSCGAVGCDDISKDIQAANKMGAAKIILDIDSPGGTVAGVPELADEIAGSKADVYAMTSGMMASAAYWLAAGTKGIFATKSADVGSIGVYTAHIDKTRALEQQGHKVELFKTGKYKASGYPGIPLTDEQRAEIQRGVDSVFAMFKEHVKNHRGNIEDEAMQGQTFMGEDAVKAGLVDEIIPNLDALKKALA